MAGVLLGRSEWRVRVALFGGALRSWRCGGGYFATLSCGERVASWERHEGAIRWSAGPFRPTVQRSAVCRCDVSWSAARRLGLPRSSAKISWPWVSPEDPGVTGSGPREGRSGECPPGCGGSRSGQPRGGQETLWSVLEDWWDGSARGEGTESL
ncbi:hypothetical protein NDU88_003128 [Pleurodeles waltl]|uniref:Uncharacterized protein n=1 Tax=Pleurodeles waltl TaxID=8319 RepID=A0AAV7UCH7_PLEWA|nr:hypothetical protein NDU88_003128 [Pleurodeles waltl]